MPYYPNLISTRAVDNIEPVGLFATLCRLPTHSLVVVFGQLAFCELLTNTLRGIVKGLLVGYLLIAGVNNVV